MVNSLSRTALLVIDVQQAYDDPRLGATRSSPHFKENIVKVLGYFRALVPRPLIIHVQHNSVLPDSPFHPTKPGNDFFDFSRPLPGEQTITKDVNSAFIGTNLEDILRQHDIRKLYCVGLTVDQCVSTTIRMANNLRVCDRDGEKGEVIMIGDATTTYSYEGLDANLIHQVHEATLGHEFCTVIQTAELVG